MGCDCPKRPPVKERFPFTALTPGGFFLHGRKGPWAAVAIGPNSLIDRCFIAPGAFPEPVKNQSTAIWRRDDLPATTIEVSVERPYIGHLDGPCLIYLPYAQNSFGGVRARAHGVNGALWHSLGGVASGESAFLDLYFYEVEPNWLPTQRAPLDYAAQVPQFGTTGPSNGVWNFPAWGRHRHHLALRFDIATAGSFDYGLVGFDSVTLNPSAAPDLSIAHELIPTTTVAADTEIVYLFDGEFDFLELTVAENAALGADSILSIVYKAWDR